jgi:hypothetical protein
MAGALKSIEMDRALDGLLCLIGSIAGCTLLCFFYFRD